jgi:NAD(P)-dependent dehydrogenase (short-subunit alcohol dehydrogenase family)
VTVVIVTGAASGIGAATAQRLRRDGVTVIAADIAEGVDHRLDVADPAGWAALVAPLRRVDGGVAAHAGAKALSDALRPTGDANAKTDL